MTRAAAFAGVLPERPLFGMIHLPALPAAPRSELTLEQVIEFALDEAAKRGPVYSAAYLIPPPPLGEVSKRLNHLRLLERMMRDGLPAFVSNASKLDGVRAALDDHAHDVLGCRQDDSIRPAAVRVQQNCMH